jgi:hypothetical protein
LNKAVKPAGGVLSGSAAWVKRSAHNSATPRRTNFEDEFECIAILVNTTLPSGESTELKSIFLVCLKNGHKQAERYIRHVQSPDFALPMAF